MVLGSGLLCFVLVVVHKIKEHLTKIWSVKFFLNEDISNQVYFIELFWKYSFENIF